MMSMLFQKELQITLMLEKMERLIPENASSAIENFPRENFQNKKQPHLLKSGAIFILKAIIFGYYFKIF